MSWSPNKNIKAKHNQSNQGQNPDNFVASGMLGNVDFYGCAVFHCVRECFIHRSGVFHLGHFLVGHLGCSLRGGSRFDPTAILHNLLCT